MKKLFTLIVAILAFCGINAQAKIIEANLDNLGSTQENTTWDAATKTFSWTAASYNSNRLNLSGDFTGFETINVELGAPTSEHFRVFIDYLDGSRTDLYFNTQKEEVSGTLTINLADNDVTAEKLTKIANVRLSGPNWMGNPSGSIVVNRVYFEGPDVEIYYPINLYPENVTSLKDLLSSNADWTKKVVFPTTFASQGKVLGYDGGGIENTADISGFEMLTLIVTEVALTEGKGAGLRVWTFDNNNQLIELYPYPADQYETADFKQPYEIKAPGVYMVNISGYDKLRGIKASNSWVAPLYAGGSVTVAYAYVSNIPVPTRAVDGIRHFSSSKALDFSSVTDVEAYIVPECEDGKVYMKKVTGVVPANTGLILKSMSDAAIVSVPTIAPFDSTLVNLLVPVAEEIEITKAERGNNYLFDGEKWVAVEESTPLNAGSSYLKASSSYSLLEASYKPLSSKSPDFIDGDASDYDPNNGLDPSDKLPGGSIESPVRPENGLVTFPEEDSENADAVGTVTGIDNAQASKRIARINSVGGALLNKLQKGVNIVTYSDGSRATVIIK